MLYGKLTREAGCEKEKSTTFWYREKVTFGDKGCERICALSENMKYSSKYATELSGLYKDAMAPKKSNAIRELRCFLAVVE